MGSQRQVSTRFVHLQRHREPGNGMREVLIRNSIAKSTASL